GCPVPPCRPVRSLRSQRGRLSRLAACAALGVLLLALWGLNGSVWTNPGPLTSSPATRGPRGADCPLQPAAFAFTGAAAAERRAAHNQLCLKCHDLGPQPHTPHGVDTALLAAWTDQARSRPAHVPGMLAAARPLVQGIASDLACAACHQEH